MFLQYVMTARIIFLWTHNSISNQLKKKYMKAHIKGSLEHFKILCQFAEQQNHVFVTGTTWLDDNKIMNIIYHVLFFPGIKY